MAQRKAFDINAGEIQAPPMIGGQADRARAAQLERFGQRLGAVAEQLTAMQARESAASGQARGAQDAAAGSFKPRRTGRVGDEAYDRSGMEAHLERVKIQAGDEAERIFNENRHDPAKLENALRAWGEGMQGQLLENMPEVASDFATAYDRITRPYLRTAAAEHQQNQEAADLGEISDSLASLTRQHEQRSFLGDTSQDGIDDIALNRDEFMTSLLKAGPKGEFELNGVRYEADDTRKGVLDPGQIAKEVAAYDRGIMSARYKGEYSRASRQGRGDKFIEQFARNDALLGELSIGERDELVRWMHGQETILSASRDAAEKAMNQKVDTAIAAIRAGATPGGLDQLRGQVRGTPKGEELELAIGNQDRLADFYKMPPRAQAAALEAERGALGKLAPADEGYARQTAAGVDLLKGMGQAQRETVAALKKDPFGFAISVGNVTNLAPIVDDNGALQVGALQQRKSEADRMSALYGFPIAGLTDDEINAVGAMQSSLAADPATRALNLGALFKGLGADQGFKVLEGMNAKGYLIDATAGDAMLDGAPDVAVMIYQGDAILAPVEGKSATKFPDEDFDLYFAQAAGTTFGFNPKAELMIKEATKRVYVSMLARNNRRPDEVPKPADVEAAFQEVLGGPLIRHGKVTVTPPARDVRGHEFDAWWDSIDAAMVKAAGGMAGWTDEDAAELIRDRGLPVEISQGVYKIVIPGSGDVDLTKAVKSNDGSEIVLHYQGR